MSKRPTAFEIEEYLQRFNYTDMINNINNFNGETLECIIIKKEQTGTIFNDFHHHSLYEMLYISKGKVQYGIEDQKYDLSAGDFILIAPNILHKLLKIVEEPCERIVLTFTSKYLDSFKTENTDLSVIFQKISSSNNHKLTVLPAFKEEIFDTLNKMQGLFLSKEYGNDILFKSYFAQLLVRLNKEVSFIETENESNEKNIIIHKAKMFAINNLDKKISIIIKKKLYIIVNGIEENITFLDDLFSAINLPNEVDRDNVDKVINKLNVGNIIIYIPIPSLPILLASAIFITIANNLVIPPPIIRIIVDLINLFFIINYMF